MSNDSNGQPTRVAVLIYRHSARHIPEYLLVQESSTPHRAWLLPSDTVAPGVAPQLAAQQIVEHVAGYVTHGLIAPADYRCPLPLWGSPDATDAAVTSVSGYEEAFMAEIRMQDGEPHFADARYGAFRWVPVIDAVSMLRYPEHVEALLRVSSKLDATG